MAGGHRAGWRAKRRSGSPRERARRRRAAAGHGVLGTWCRPLVRRDWSERPVAFLIARAASAPIVLDGKRVRLRPYVNADHAAWAELRRVSRAHLEPWEPAWRDADLDRRAFRARVQHYAREVRQDAGYAYGVFRSGDGKLMGGIGFSHVRRGVTQAAVLGYWLGSPYLGRGYMTEAVRLMLGFAFQQLCLNRVEAASMPSNSDSIRILERTGFRREGVARRYLQINGVFEDHILFAHLADEFARGAGET
ncbi:MAG: GNAT family protein [Hyphomicrobiaceae bacterium]|nr:GNAT family protein [Hyphomicrobiaceae bacterium]